MKLEPVDRSEVAALLESDAFTIDNPDSSDHGRTIIHTRSSHGFGADWDLDSAIALIDDDRVSWEWNVLGQLRAVTPDDVFPRGVTFDNVRRPPLPTNNQEGNTT